MVGYRLLFSLAVEHQFFGDGGCPELDFVPTPESDRLLQQAGLIALSTAHGIEVFFDDARSDVLRLCLTDADEPTALTWKVFSCDPLFANYTDPLPYRADAILYFDNRAAHKDASGFYRLHAADVVSASDFKALESADVQPVLSKRDRLIRPHFLVTIDLRGHIAGRKTTIRTSHPRRYQIRFKVRETVWTYYLFTDLPLEQPYVLDLNRRVEFDCLGTSQFPNNRSALTFRSRQSLPLQASPTARFQLREKHAGGERVLIKRLPVASADQLDQAMIEGASQFVSDIFIHC